MTEKKKITVKDVLRGPTGPGPSKLLRGFFELVQSVKCSLIHRVRTERLNWSLFPQAVRILNEAAARLPDRVQL